MPLPTDKRLGGNLISVRDPLPALLVDQNGAPLVFPAALGQTTAALSTPVVLNSDAEFVKAEDAAAASGDKGIPALFRRNTANSALTDTDGDYGNPTVDSTGATRVVGSVNGGNGSLMIVGTGTSGDAGADGVSNTVYFSNANRVAVVAGHVFNGATWDRQRGNIDTTVLASAARTATPTKVNQTNYNGRSLVLVIDVTAVPGSAPSVVFTIQGYDPLSTKYYTILASAAITGVGTTVLRVSPHYAATVANLVAIDTVPRTWAVDAVHGNANSVTYTVAALWVA